MWPFLSVAVHVSFYCPKHPNRYLPASASSVPRCSLQYLLPFLRLVPSAVPRTCALAGAGAWRVPVPAPAGRLALSRSRPRAPGSLLLCRAVHARLLSGTLLPRSPDVVSTWTAHRRRAFNLSGQKDCVHPGSGPGASLAGMPVSVGDSSPFCFPRPWALASS